MLTKYTIVALKIGHCKDDHAFYYVWYVFVILPVIDCNFFLNVLKSNFQLCMSWNLTMTSQDSGSSFKFKLLHGLFEVIHKFPSLVGLWSFSVLRLCLYAKRENKMYIGAKYLHILSYRIWYPNPGPGLNKPLEKATVSAVYWRSYDFCNFLDLVGIWQVFFLSKHQ